MFRKLAAAMLAFTIILCLTACGPVCRNCSSDDGGAKAEKTGVLKEKVLTDNEKKIMDLCSENTSTSKIFDYYIDEKGAKELSISVESLRGGKWHEETGGSWGLIYDENGTRSFYLTYDPEKGGFVSTDSSKISLSKVKGWKTDETVCSIGTEKTDVKKGVKYPVYFCAGGSSITTEGLADKYAHPEKLKKYRGVVMVTVEFR